MATLYHFRDGQRVVRKMYVNGRSMASSGLNGSGCRMSGQRVVENTKADFSLANYVIYSVFGMFVFRTTAPKMERQVSTFQ